MPLQIGPITATSFANLGGTNIMAVPRGEAVALLRKYSLIFGALNALGLFTLQSVGNNNKVNFMNFVAPKHVFQPRLNGCSWNAKGKIGSQQTKLELQSIEYDGEQCPDAFYGPWEKIFGTGTDIIQFTSTPEGQAVVNEMIRLIYEGLGNSLHELVEFGQHPLIDQSNDNAWFPAEIEATEWADYVGQQASATGRITLVDGLKADGLDHFNVDIDGYLNASGAWTGDIFAFLDSLIRARRVEFKVSENQIGGTIKGIIEMDEVTFDELGTQILANYTGIPDQYRLFVQGENGIIALNNALKYKGYACVPNSSWTAFDSLTGTITRRALMSFPGVYGLAYDVEALDAYNGLGLLVQQLPDFRLKGRMDFWTALKLGNVVLDTNFVVNASQAFTPE